MLKNHGLVESGASGIAASAVVGVSSTVVNDGTIRALAGSGGSAPAVALSSGSRVQNAGTIQGIDLGDGHYGTAIAFSGGNNTLRLLAGSTILGNVVVTSSSFGNDSLEVGADTDAHFDTRQLGAVGSAAQYQGFATLRKYGNGTLTVSGGASVGSWSVLAGTMISDFSTASGSVGIADGATFVYDQATDGTLSAPFSVSGGTFIKRGAGALTLPGDAGPTGGGTIFQPGRRGTTYLAEGTLIVGDDTYYAPNLYGMQSSVPSGTPAPAGTDAVIASPGTTLVLHRGLITGGSGAYGSTGYAGGSGGAGVSGSGYNLVNASTIDGGAGFSGADAAGAALGGTGGTGAIGVTSVVNRGYIFGGAGTSGGTYQNDRDRAGRGGTGIDTSAATIENLGSIGGGVGGDSYSTPGLGRADTGSTGGVGIRIQGSTIHNATGALIRGGGGGRGGGDTTTPVAYQGQGGVAIVAAGNTRVVNDGTISGGLGFSWTYNWLQADALHFSGGGNVLEVHPGSVINGKVVSTSGATNGGDTVILGATTPTGPALSGSSDLAQFSGFRTFRKVDAGTWVLLGSGRLADSGRVEAGALMIGDATHTGGVLSGDVTVAKGAMLGGTGRIDGVVRLDVGATLLPGLGLGSLIVACDLSLLSGSQLSFTQAAGGALVGAAPTALEVAGHAELHGGVAMDLAGGGYTFGSRYTLLTASQGVEGQFERVTLSPGYSRYVDAVVAYAPSSVSIAFAPTAAAYNDHAASYANTVSAALDSTFQTILGDIDTDPGERREDARSGVWAQGVHNEGALGGDDQSVHGGAVGGGVAVGEGSVLGIAVAGANTETTSNLDRVKAKPLGAFGYGVFNSGAWRLAASVGGGHLKQTTTRRLSDVGLSTSADSTGRFYGAAARLDYRWTPDRFAIAPFVQASYLNSRYGKAGEDGAGMLDLSYGKLSQKLTRYEGGVRVSASFGETTSFVPWMQVGAVGWTGDRRAAVDETIGGFTQRVRGTGLPSSATAASAGVNLVSGAWRFGLAYKGTFGDDYHAHGGSATAEYHW